MQLLGKPQIAFLFVVLQLNLFIGVFQFNGIQGLQNTNNSLSERQIYILAGLCCIGYARAACISRQLG